MQYKEQKLREFVKPFVEYIKTTNITAEELTLFRIFSGLAVAGILLRGGYIASLIAIIVYQFVLLLDYVDGPIARHKKSFKLSWVYLDFMAHLVLMVLFITAVSYSVFAETGDFAYLVLGFATSLAILFNNIFNKGSFMAVRFNKLQKEKGRKEAGGSESSLVASLLRIEEPLSLFFILIVLNFGAALIFIYSTLYIAGALYKFVLVFDSLGREK